MLKTYYLKDLVYIYYDGFVFSLPIDYNLELNRFIKDDPTWLECFGKCGRGKDRNADFFLIPINQRVDQLDSFKAGENLFLKRKEWKLEIEKSIEVYKQILANYGK